MASGSEKKAAPAAKPPSAAKATSSGKAPPAGKTTAAGKASLSDKKAAAGKDSASTKSKMHRRSRSGCFTCRLRRKKCDEGQPKCRACRNLCLDCEYKRPSWWSNSETRRRHKEQVKEIIKTTKTNEKTTAQAQYGLQHAGKAMSEDSSDPYDGTLDPSFMTTPSLYDPYGANMYLPADPCAPGFPWEVDVKTERHTYVNDELTRQDSSISTFTTFHPPPGGAMLPSYVGDDWMLHNIDESQKDTWSGEEGMDFNFFEFPNLTQQPRPQCSMVPLEDCDRPLFDHLLESVLPLLFPILEANQHGSVKADVILPALENNKAYLHSCLLAAATHLRGSNPFASTTAEDDAMRHKLAFVTIVVESLNNDAHHAEMLDALLGMIALQGCVGTANDIEKELIPWHQHFQAATDIVQKLNLPLVLENQTQTGGQPPFNMTLTAWVDILGSTMLGKAPRFSNTYRNMFFAGASSGLEKLMGCNDYVMYLLSEIACLDSLKVEGKLDDIGICNHITSLAQTLDQIETHELLEMPFAKSGALRPKQLSNNITALFRKAARIYLCSLVPEYSRYQSATVNLVTQMAEMLHYIPSGPNGFDRCIVWPLLICGANSIPGSPFRRALAERCDMLGDSADQGAFGRMVRLLHEVWRRNDDIAISSGVCEATPVTIGSPGGSISTPIAPASACAGAGASGSNAVTMGSTTLPSPQNVHWRDVMQQNGWDFLLL